MKDHGWIRLHRESINSQIFRNPCMWKLWTLCLMKATYKEIDLPVGDLPAPVHLAPGQFVMGRKALWEEFHQLNHRKRKPRKKPTPSANTLQNWLHTWQKMGKIRIKTTNRYSIVTIINWVHYQQKQPSSDNGKKKDTPAIVSPNWKDLYSND